MSSWKFLLVGLWGAMMSSCGWREVERVEFGTLPEPSGAEDLVVGEDWRERDFDYEKRKDVVFTPEGWPEEVLADVWLPERDGDELSPVVLMVHGGAWRGKDGRWMMDHYAKEMVRRGVAVVNMTYRLGPEWDYPAPMEDMHAVLAEMEERAGDYGWDAQRLGLWGFSAGGQMVSLFATQLEQGRVKAMVAGGAPQDLRAWPENEILTDYMGGNYESKREQWEEASPLLHVDRGMPPVFLYHGTNDKQVWPLNTEWMMERLVEVGLGGETVWMPGRGHVGSWLMGHKARSWAAEFLCRYL